ncbi:MAG: hypothetical protein WC736_15495 [Gallionella sp.]|jgi:hypothetical protein
MKIINVQYHRNGVGGIGFYAVHFQDKAHKDMANTTKDFVAVLFPNDDGEDTLTVNGRCAVLNVGLLPDVTFAVNSWRGDHFEPDLRRAIRDYEEAQTAKYAKA